MVVISIFDYMHQETVLFYEFDLLGNPVDFSLKVANKTTRIFNFL